MLFDDILCQIGQFGFYQILIYFLLCFLAIPAGWQNLAVTFYSNKYHYHWCRVERLNGLNDSLQWNIAIPYSGNDDDNDFRYDKCKMYDLNYGLYNRSDFLNWNRSISENASVIDCNNGWNFVNGYRTVMEDFNLVCSRSGLVPLISTIYFCGFLTGTVVCGQISDTFGRKKTIMVTLFFLVASSVSAAFVPSSNLGYAIFVILRFIVGFNVAGSYTTGFVISMEIIGPKYRSKLGILVQAWFAIGFMTLPWMAKALPNYRHLQLVCGGIPIIFLTYAFIIDESPRWLICEKKDERAEKIIAKMARYNRTTVPENLYLAENRLKSTSDKAHTILDLLRTPNLRKITLNMWITWLVVSLVYYGLSLEAGNMGNLDLYLSNFISGSVEIPAYIITVLIIDKIGRKIPTVGSTLIGGGSCLIGIAFVFGKKSIALTICSTLGKFFVSSAFAIVYVWSAEVFPTVARNVGVGSSSMAARVGSLVAPQIGRLNQTWKPLPFLIFGATSAISGICSLFIPETLNKQLPETIEEGEQFGISNSKVSPAEDKEKEIAMIAYS